MKIWGVLVGGLAWLAGCAATDSVARGSLRHRGSVTAISEWGVNAANSSEDYSGHVVPDKLMPEVVAAEAADAPLVVSVVAPWCQACGKLKSAVATMQQLATSPVRVHYIDLDENRDLVPLLGITHIPATFIYRHKQLVHHFSGPVEPKEFYDYLRNLS